MNLLTWGMLILLSLFWGGSFLFGRIAVLEISPLNTVFFRVTLAAIALWIWIFFRQGLPQISLSFATAIFGMAILNNVIPFSLILYGQQEIGSGLASIINAMTPVWTVIIAHFATSDEKLNGLKSIGILAGFTGVVILLGGDLLTGLASSAIAQLAVLLATISYGFAAIFGKRFTQDDSLLVAAGQLTASSLIMAVIVVASGTIFTMTMPSQAAFLSIIGIAIPSTAIAYVLFFKILAQAGATNVSLVTFLVPVSAILLGIIVLGEALTTRQIFGTALIISGLAIIDGRFFKAFR